MVCALATPANEPKPESEMTVVAVRIPEAIFVANLEKRNIRGIESDGMILAADDNEGKVIFLTTENDIDVGSKIK